MISHNGSGPPGCSGVTAGTGVGGGSIGWGVAVAGGAGGGVVGVMVGTVTVGVTAIGVGGGGVDVGVTTGPGVSVMGWRRRHRRAFYRHDEHLQAPHSSRDAVRVPTNYPNSLVNPTTAEIPATTNNPVVMMQVPPARLLLMRERLSKDRVGSVR